MTTISVSPFVLKDSLLTIGTDNYEAHVSQVIFNNATSTVTWVGLSPPSAFSDTSTPTWECTLSLAQDWTTPNSLARYLFDHAGEEVEAVFTPRNGVTGSTVVTAQITLTAPSIGGEVNTVAVSSVTCGVHGEPVLTTLAAAE